jgi:hypothetical protein
VRNGYAFPYALLAKRGCASDAKWRHSLLQKAALGKAEPFRTSGGKAATRSS